VSNANARLNARRSDVVITIPSKVRDDDMNDADNLNVSNPGTDRDDVDEKYNDDDSQDRNRTSMGRRGTVKRRRESDSSESIKVSTEASESLNEGMSAQSYKYNRDDDDKSLGALSPSSKVNITNAAKKIPASELDEFLRFADAVYKAYENADKALKDALDHAGDLDKVRWEPRWIKRWNDITTALREQFHPGKEKGANLVSPIVQSRVYYGWAFLSLSRLVSYSALLAQKLVGEDSILVREPACSITRVSAAVPTALVAVPATIHALVMFRDHLTCQARYWTSMAQAWAHLEGALDYVNSETSSKANSLDWETFMSACRKNPHLSQDAKLEQVRARASVRRDCVVLPSNIALSISAQLGLILGAPAAVSGGLLAGSGLAYLAQGYLDRQQGLDAEAPRAQSQIETAKRRLTQLRRNSGDEEYLAAAKRTFRTRQRVLRAKQTRELWGGWLRGYVKANANFVIGLASLGFGTYFLINAASAASPASAAANATLHVNATDFTDSDPSQCYNSASTSSTMLSSAGTLIGMVANAVGCVYYPLTGIKVAGRSANESKELQRQAQVLIAWWDEEDLVDMILDDECIDILSPKGKFIESEGWSSVTKKTVFPADNEYIGLHLIAQQIMRELDQPEFDDQCQVFEWLRTESKMRQTDIRSMLQIARSTARVRRLDVIKQRLAPWVGTEFRLSSASKQERALKASVIVNLATNLCADERIGLRLVSTRALAQSAYQLIRDKLHAKVTPEAFILAVEKVWNERIRGVPTTALAPIELLVELAKAARQVRSDELAAISNMSKADRNILGKSSKITKTMRAEFQTGVREYAELELDDFAGQAAALGKLGKKPLTTLLMANPSLVQSLDCAAQLERLLNQIDPAEPGAAKGLASVASNLQLASGYETTTVDGADSGNDAQNTTGDQAARARAGNVSGGMETERAQKIHRRLTNMRTQTGPRSQDRPLTDAFQDPVEVDD
jgi:hypothetical protein